MSWKQIIVGVDASPAAARAAQLGIKIAAVANAECRLVHATRDTWSLVAEGGLQAQAAAFRAAALHEVRAQIEAALAGEVPWDVLHDLQVREGWPPAALDDEQPPLTTAPELRPVASEMWRGLIKRVWEVDPLRCPLAGG